MEFCILVPFFKVEKNVFFLYAFQFGQSAQNWRYLWLHTSTKSLWMGYKLDFLWPHRGQGN